MINHKFKLDLSLWSFLGMTLILSLFSYYFIEIRKWRITMVIASFSIILIAAGSIYCTQGANYRTPGEYHLTALEYHTEYYGGRNYNNITTLPFINADEDTYDYLIIGDSFARQYTQFIEDNNIKAKIRVADGCLVMRDHLTEIHFTGDGGMFCHEFSKEVLSDIQESSKPIIWAQNWIAYNGYQLPLINSKNAQHSTLTSSEIIQAEIAQIAEHNRDKKIFIIGTPIPAPDLITDCLAQQYLLGYRIIKQDCTTDHPKQEIPINNDIESSIQRYPNVHYIDPNDILCNEQNCSLETDDSQAIFSDLNHLSIYGAALIGPIIFKKVDVLRH